MVDLSPLFAIGEALVRDAVRTGGTTVRLETRVTTRDPDTLRDTVATTVLGTHPALVVPAGNVNATTDPVPGVELRPGDWKVVLAPDVTPPPVGAWVVVEASRDLHLPGMDAKVLGHSISSAGAVLLVFARPGPAQ